MMNSAIFMFIGFFIIFFSFAIIFQNDLGWIIFGISVIIMFYGAIRAEILKKQTSIKTYKEILEFFESNK